MGQSIGRSIYIEDEPIGKPEVYEKYLDETRPVREMHTTTEEMDLSQIRRCYRDYCAHLYMDYMKCRRDWFPQWYKCSDVLHKYQHCSVNDLKHRTMEYERAKRLMARDKRQQRELIDEE